MDKRFLHLFAACFLVGITFGSIIGLGGGAEVSLSDSVAFEKYLAACLLTNLPFWCCILMPCTFRHRIVFPGAALVVKGALIGCSSVFIFSAGSVCYYINNVMPQIIFTAPLYIIIAAKQLGRGERAYTNYAILTNLLLSILVTFLSSCVQYLIFFGFYTIQGLFITKF